MTTNEQVQAASRLTRSMNRLANQCQAPLSVWEEHVSAVGNAVNLLAASRTPTDPALDAATVELKPFLWSRIQTIAYEACDGTIWKTAEQATQQSRKAQALARGKARADG